MSKLERSRCATRDKGFKGMLAARNRNAVAEFVKLFKESGYTLSMSLLNVADYGVPQDRKRVFYIGIRNDLNKKFIFPKPLKHKVTLRDAIGDLQGLEVKALDYNKSNGDKCKVLNHEYMNGGFSTIYMSRNRVRGWGEQSFTIQAGGRHAPLHPQAPKMQFVEQNKRIFMLGKEDLYRRFTVRECARVQTFPDDFKFYYTNIANAYKMIGNAVPVKFAQIIAEEIKKV